jgi:uroporphyrinogen-III synthase
MANSRGKTRPAADRHAPLAGATVIVTRPAGTGASLARLVRKLGGHPVLLPGLSLRAMSERKPPAGARDRFDDWIFTSPAAVRFGATVLPRVRKRDRVFALGAGTARALARHGLRATMPRDRMDSEGLLALAELAQVRGRRIALVGAPGGRDLIAPTLRRRGAMVEAVHVYRRVPPRLARRHFDALSVARDPLVMLVSSGEALTYLVTLLPAVELARLRGQIVVVSSARLVGAARENGFSEIVQARSAAPRDLLAAAASALARHRH